VLPPAADAVSLQTAVALNANAAAHEAIAGQGVTELGRAGVGVAESGTSYVTGDAMAASSYVIARG
jgi:hypothetical protein